MDMFMSISEQALPSKFQGKWV